MYVKTDFIGNSGALRLWRHGRQNDFGFVPGVALHRNKTYDRTIPASDEYSLVFAIRAEPRGPIRVGSGCVHRAQSWIGMVVAGVTAKSGSRYAGNFSGVVGFGYSNVVRMAGNIGEGARAKV